MKDKPFPRKCPNCRQRAVSSDVVEYTTRIEHDGRAYDVSVPRLRVLKCAQCGEVNLPRESEEQVTDALRSAAGLLPPEEIRAGRLALGLTQKALAEQLDIAEATLCRWETGAQIQQRAFDKLLRAYFDVPELRTYLALGPAAAPVG
jgi:putative zinc finger/helix-turn-helix YgiT family protein